MPFYAVLDSYKDDENYPKKADWISRRLITLRYDLHKHITEQRQPDSLIIGSWNIQAFDGGLPRLDESYHYIAEIIAAFDICAIQEVKVDLAPLRKLLSLLGPNWDYFVSDTSDHEGGNSERIAFIYNKNKVFFRNLIGEIVVGKNELPSSAQIARSPFFSAFQAGWFRFALVSTHITYGPKDEAGLQLRADEITAISNAIAKKAKSEDQVYIFLGDMNIESRDDVIMQALTDSDLELPEFPATNMNGEKFFDHIAFSVNGKSTRKTKLLRHGAFDWRDAVYPRKGRVIEAEDDPDHVVRPTMDEVLVHYEPVVKAHRKENNKEPYSDFASSYTRWTSTEMSDHLPVWIELETDYSNEYLMRYFQ